MERSKSSSVRDAWARLETWLGAKLPGQALPDGASNDDITRAEAAIGLPFPAELSELYKRHNGSNRIWLCERGFIIPLYDPEGEHLVDSWTFMKSMVEKGAFSQKSEPIGPIKADWWNTKWIPVTANLGGDYICVDLDPGPGGTKGQVIAWWHEKGASEVLAEGVGAWLSGVAEDLEDGSFDPENR